jgi:hypothetical protein
MHLVAEPCHNRHLLYIIRIALKQLGGINGVVFWGLFPLDLVAYPYNPFILYCGYQGHCRGGRYTR